MSKRDFKLRLAVAEGDKIGSSIWRIWKHRTADDIYFAVRSLAGAIKVSLHASGLCHLAFSYQYWSAGKALNAARRDLISWTREDVGPNGWRSAAQIYIPAEFLADTGQTIDAETYLISAPQPGKAVIIDMIYSRRGIGELRRPPGSIELGNATLSDGHYFIILGGIVPFDVEAFKLDNRLDRPRLAGLSNPELLDVNRAVIYSDAEKERHLKLVDIGGIKLTKR